MRNLERSRQSSILSKKPSALFSPKPSITLRNKQILYILDIKQAEIGKNSSKINSNHRGKDYMFIQLQLQLYLKNTLQYRTKRTGPQLALANLGRTVTLEDYNENKEIDIQNLQRRLT